MLVKDQDQEQQVLLYEKEKENEIYFFFFFKKKNKTKNIPAFGFEGVALFPLFTFCNSIKNNSTALGGTTGRFPSAPYPRRGGMTMIREPPFLIPTIPSCQP